MQDVDIHWIEDLVAAETQLRAAADVATNKPAQLIITDGGPADAKWRWIISVLQERGFRTAVDDQGELWFYPPGPLTPPSDLQRQYN
jgi:hypothetical protein